MPKPNYNEAPEEARWPEWRVDLLKKLLNEKLSASEIAKKIGPPITRNGVIGKVHRLGLDFQGSSMPKGQKQERRKKERPPPPLASAVQPDFTFVEKKAEAPKILPFPEPKPLEIGDGPVTILHLSDKTCKWPVGMPEDAEDKLQIFCGHGPRDGSPYCEYHSRMAYQPAYERRTQQRVA